MMKHKLKKLIFALITHTVIVCVVYLLILRIPGISAISHNNPLFPVMNHVIFNIIYFLILWLKLYIYDFAYFLHFSKNIILRSLATTILVMGFLVALVVLNLHSLQDAQASNLSVDRYLAMAGAIVIINIDSLLILYGAQYWWIHHLISLGYLRKNVLIIGDPDPRFPSAFRKQNNGVKNYQGRLFRQGAAWYHQDAWNHTTRVSAQQIGERLFQLKIGEVVLFLCGSLTKNDVNKLISLLSENSINYYIVPEINKLSRAAFTADSFPYVPIIRKSVAKRDSVVQITFKRCIDIILVSLSLFILLPLGVLIAFLIKLGDGGPVFYMHKRVGINGRLITFFKFRSMIINAESLKKSLLPFNKRVGGPLFKMENDPRITPVGRIIRRFSLDELPQLLNVLKGDLSLVGPRPHLETEVNAYAERDLLRLECIPGITCLPQLAGRDTISFRKWVELDLVYRRRWSLALDLKILILSLNVVLAPLFRRS